MVWPSKKKNPSLKVSVRYQQQVYLKNFSINIAQGRSTNFAQMVIQKFKLNKIYYNKFINITREHLNNIFLKLLLENLDPVDRINKF